ncbi:MAG: translation elongation factor Ts [Gemmatimonadaceae bacterium]|nr:translation elongation factor Ts [Gemmatimonadaceae bacterium]
MAAITAKDVAELRARTGAGMMDCKKALEEAGGEMDKAVDILRTKGIAKADKRADRAASEGQIVTWVAPDSSAAAMIELNSETDFVGRNDEFVAVAKTMCEQVAKDASVDGAVKVGADGAYLATPWYADASRTVGEVVKAASAKTGENVVLKGIARFTPKAGGTVGFYLHFNGKAGVLVEVAGITGEAGTALANTIAEHVAAGVPATAIAVNRAEVDPAVVKRERDIFVEQAIASGKPPAIAEKMVDGRINKFFGEIVLTEQPWVREDSKTIGQIIKEAGAGASVVRFARFKMGEG